MRKRLRKLIQTVYKFHVKLRSEILSQPGAFSAISRMTRIDATGRTRFVMKPHELDFDPTGTTQSNGRHPF